MEECYFRKEDCGAALFKEWGAYRDVSFEYKKGETWDRLLHQGIHLLETFARQDRVRIHDPHNDLQIKEIRTLGVGSEFIAYLDAIGEVDGVRCLIDWKTTTSRYPEAPEGLFSLDPQLICYSWISGIPEAAMVVFVRKHVPEAQYLRATISEEQRLEFGRLVETTVNQIEGRALQSAQWYQVPSERMHDLPTSRTLPSQRRARSGESSPQTGSEQP